MKMVISKISVIFKDLSFFFLERDYRADTAQEILPTKNQLLDDPISMK